MWTMAIRTAYTRPAVQRSLVEHATTHTRVPRRVHLRDSSRTMSTSQEPHITPINASDFDEWAQLFRGYIDFYKSSIPDTQYRRTFDRIIDPSKDLYGLALRDAGDDNKLIGIAHFYPHQTPWGEKPIMHFNGVSTLYPFKKQFGALCK